MEMFFQNWTVLHPKKRLKLQFFLLSTNLLSKKEGLLKVVLKGNQIGLSLVSKVI